MAQIEVLDDFKKETSEKEGGSKKGNKFTKLLKKKPFLIAVIGVSLLGLYAWYKKSQNPTATASEDETATGESLLIASGYGGGYADNTYQQSDLSYMADAYNSLKSTYEDNLLDMQDTYEESISKIQSAYDTDTSNLVSQVETLFEKYNTQEDIIQTQAGEIQKQQDIALMMSNSDKYHLTTSEAEQKALHEANDQIAKKYGFTYGDDGYWYDGDTRVYSTALQTSKQSSSGSSSPTTKTASKSTSSSSGGTNPTTGKAQMDITTNKGYTNANIKTNPTTGQKYSTTMPDGI